MPFGISVNNNKKEKKMKNVLIAGAVAAITATHISAAEIGSTGISIGAKLDGNYTTGVEEWSIDFVPEAGFSKWGIDFKGSTTIDVIELNDGDIFQGLDLEAGYSLVEGLRAYGEVSADADLEFGDITMGVSFSF